MPHLAIDWHTIGTMMIQIMAALVAGGLIGLERSYHGRAAGFRTFSLVALGACLLMVATSNPLDWRPPVDSGTRIDPSRVMQGIVTGVGFLGAGVIFRDGFTVRGLTTAACIWVVSAIGVLFGIGFYTLGTAGTVLTLIVLSLFKRIEAMMPANQYSYLSISFARANAPSEQALTERLAQFGLDAQEIGYGIQDQGELFEYHATLRTDHADNIRQLVDNLRQDPQVMRFRLSPTSD
ncbi:MAG TPA: MgtC/SapB family protein [Burkholderiaceae bacterium]|nr:MgtC/SapB family protein [Burkholderiaceae bacterium]